MVLKTAKKQRPRIEAMARFIYHPIYILSMILFSYFVHDISLTYFSSEIVTDYALSDEYLPNPTFSICMPKKAN